MRNFTYIKTKGNYNRNPLPEHPAAIFNSEKPPPRPFLTWQMTWDDTRCRGTSSASPSVSMSLKNTSAHSQGLSPLTGRGRTPAFPWHSRSCPPEKQSDREGHVGPLATVTPHKEREARDTLANVLWGWGSDGTFSLSARLDNK